ncbi:MAG: C1 family peptidase [Anaerolineae bacterium]
MPSDGVSPQAVPSSWDWRQTGKVTPVKNQSTCGSCYSFAALGNIEAKMLIDSATTYDFSENNAKECNWYETSGTGGGTSCDGGNYDQMANLFSKKGTVLESCDPYQASDVTCKSTCPYQKTLLDWHIISTNAVPNANVLKQYIQTYGPVYTSLYAGDGDAWDTELGNYDGTYTLYHAGTETPNHAVLIVGWDDSLTHDGGTGGWIVKNSWGTGWGGTCGYGSERGYFTIAYGSASIGKWSSFMYDWQDYDANGGLMYYDESGWSASTGYGNTTAWGLVKFIPSSNTYATRVEFWTTDAPTNVDVYVYDDFNGTAPSNLLASKENLSFDEAGYHSVALDSPLAVTSGDDVIAVVKFTNDSYTYPVPIDYDGPKETGRTYKSSSGASGSWTESSYDVAIRLRTSTALGPDVSITKQVVGSDFEPGDPIVFTLAIANSGAEVASQVVVTDVVPTEVLAPTFASTLAITRTGVLTYVWNVEPLGIGESGVISIYGQIDPGLGSNFSFANTATISDPEDNTPSNNSNSAAVGERKVYLPLVIRCFPLQPSLDSIDNPDGDGVYTVSWSRPSCGPSPSYYQLQGDGDSQFGSPSTFTENGTTFDAYSSTPGTYYWRVRANLSGTGWSEWSNVQSVTVGNYAHVWIDNDTGGSLTVEIVGVEKKSFSTGVHYWRSIPAGRYTYKAWARCGSGTWTDDFSAGEVELDFWCSYGAALTSAARPGDQDVYGPSVIKDLNAMR